jgi:hypothetical protein
MPWFRYESVRGSSVPWVRARLSQGGHKSVIIKFLVDSGAAMSFVPRGLVGRTFGDLSSYQEESTGAKGVDGNWLRGIPLELDISVVDRDIHGRPVPELSAIRERVWIHQGPWALLGQTWLERVGANFQNFPARPGGQGHAYSANSRPPGTSQK